MNGTLLDDFRNADGTFLIATSTEGLQRLFSVTAAAREKLGLKISAIKPNV